MKKKDKGGIPTPDVIDPPLTMRMTLCIPRNKDHMMAFFGALWELTMWDSWQPDDAHTGKDLAAVWLRYWMSWNRSMNEIDCEDGMSDCCTEPQIIRRVNPSTGQVEQSSNGGTTWQPAAGGINDYIVRPIPPVTSGVAATKCDAATNVSEQINVWIEHTTDDFDTAISLLEFGLAVAEAILIAVTALLTAGTLTAAELAVLPTIAAACAAAWGAGKAVFVDYWTTDILNKILCAIYCNIGEDGSFTDAQFASTWSQINGDLPPSPAKMLLMGFLSSSGTTGLCAMAATGFSADADCSDCVACLECAERWSIFGGSHGTILSRTLEYVEVQASDGGNGNFYVIMKTPNADTCCGIDHLEAVTGSASLHGWNNCGETQVEGVPAHTGTGFGACMNYVQLQDANPFTVKIFFVDCP